MKTISMLFLGLILALPLSAEYVLRVPALEARAWTQVATGKQITAKLVEKSEDGEKVKLEMVGGKTAWVDLKGLGALDKEFVAQWKPLPKDFQYITVKDLPEPPPHSEYPAKDGWTQKTITISTLEDALNLTVFQFTSDTKPLQAPSLAVSTTRSMRFFIKNDFLIQLHDQSGKLVAEIDNQKAE